MHFFKTYVRGLYDTNVYIKTVSTLFLTDGILRSDLLLEVLVCRFLLSFNAVIVQSKLRLICSNLYINKTRVNCVFFSYRCDMVLLLAYERPAEFFIRLLPEELTKRYISLCLTFNF